MAQSSDRTLLLDSRRHRPNHWHQIRTPWHVMLGVSVLQLAAPWVAITCLFHAQTLYADIYTRIDANGTIHFTNMPSPGKRWRRIMRTGPGKAATVHAARPTMALTRERYHLYDEHMQQASALYRIPMALIRAVTHVESDYYPLAISSAGAKGLMQLMPQTAAGMGVSDVFDPRQNIFGGTRYLRILANQFAGDLVRTIASYHAGPAAVQRYDGVPPYATTQRYVRMVLSRYQQYRKAELPTAGSSTKAAVTTGA